MPGIGTSHLIYFGTLGKELQLRGHDVQLLTNSRVKIPSLLREGLSWRQFPVDTDLDKAKGLMDMITDNAVNGGSPWTNLYIISQHMKMFDSEARQLFKDTETLEFVRQGEFDFLIIDNNHALFALPYILDVPFAYFSTECHPWESRTPALPSYAPIPLAPSSDHMTLSERAFNTFLFLLMTPMLAPARDMTFIRDFLPPGRPLLSASELVTRADLCFRLREKIIDTPRPLNPNMVDIGGVMARPAQPLPPDLKKLVESAENVVILMSFGSLFNELPADIIVKFVEVFRKVRLTFLWKFNAEVPNLPRNVHRMTWIPQNDLLGHPNVKLFITHGGANSMMEAVYHGVPLILFPLGIDQGFNAQLSQSKDYGLRMNIASFTAEEMAAAIHDVLGGNYTKSVKEAFFRQLPPAGDTAEFWIDHVIKYGSKHIRPHSQDMVWYKYLMVDLLVILLSAILLLITLLYGLYRLICRIACGSKRKSKTE